jgi:hypothetical protein
LILPAKLTSDSCVGRAERCAAFTTAGGAPGRETPDYALLVAILLMAFDRLATALIARE